MSATVANEVIGKLLSQPLKDRQLVFNSPAANKKFTQLRAIITDIYIDESNIRTVAAFLQFVDLSLFTTDELNYLVRFDYSRIEAQKIIPDLDKQDLNNPYYDLDNTIINIDLDTRRQLRNKFTSLLSINKSLSLAFLVNYIISQL